MSFPAYSEYKDSGVEWLAEVPKHWTLKRFKQIFTERGERSVDGSEELMSVSAYYGVKPRLETLDDGDHLSRADSLEGYKICRTNDLVMNIMLAWNRGLGFSWADGIVSPAYSVFYITDGSNPKYLDYLVRSDEMTRYYKAFSSGVIDSRLRLYPESFGRLYVAMPNLEEQTQIASFLDHETGRIDALIEEQQRLIELLTEKRQAVISHAVTKGLDPNVPMKDSGVEWLGQVPAHWEVKKLGYIGQARNGLTYSPDNIVEDSDSGTLVLRSSNIQSAKISLLDNVYVNSRIPDNLRVRESDILICSRNGSRALIGKNALIPKELDGQSFGAFMMIFRSKINNFIYWILNSPIFNYQSSSFLTATINQLTNDNLTGMLIPLPPLTEQEEIVQYLNKKTSEIDILIDEVKSGIDFLKERRSALISAAVTGKIDVRGWQPQASTAVPSLERE